MFTEDIIKERLQDLSNERSRYIIEFNYGEVIVKDISEISDYDIGLLHNKIIDLESEVQDLEEEVGELQDEIDYYETKEFSYDE